MQTSMDSSYFGGSAARAVRRKKIFPTFALPPDYQGIVHGDVAERERIVQEEERVMRLENPRMHLTSLVRPMSSTPLPMPTQSRLCPKMPWKRGASANSTLQRTFSTTGSFYDDDDVDDINPFASTASDLTPGGGGGTERKRSTAPSSGGNKSMLMDLHRGNAFNRNAPTDANNRSRLLAPQSKHASNVMSTAASMRSKVNTLRKKREAQSKRNVYTMKELQDDPMLDVNVEVRKLLKREPDRRITQDPEFRDGQLAAMRSVEYALDFVDSLHYQLYSHFLYNKDPIVFSFDPRDAMPSPEVCHEVMLFLDGPCKLLPWSEEEREATLEAYGTESFGDDTLSMHQHSADPELCVFLVDDASAPSRLRQRVNEFKLVGLRNAYSNLLYSYVRKILHMDDDDFFSDTSDLNRNTSMFASFRKRPAMSIVSYNPRRLVSVVMSPRGSRNTSPRTAQKLALAPARTRISFSVPAPSTSDEAPPLLHPDAAVSSSSSAAALLMVDHKGKRSPAAIESVHHHSSHQQDDSLASVPQSQTSSPRSSMGSATNSMSGSMSRMNLPPTRASTATASHNNKSVLRK
eukprot:PhM_4_TR16089/c1_g1_i1/m.38564